MLCTHVGCWYKRVVFCDRLFVHLSAYTVENFVCVGYFLYQTCSCLNMPAANDSEYIGKLCNGSAVIRDFTWSLTQHVWGPVRLYMTVFLTVAGILWTEIRFLCGLQEMDLCPHWCKAEVSLVAFCCQQACRQSGIMCAFNMSLYFPFTGYPSLRIEKNDLRSVTLMEAKAKVKDIAISRERVTLRDVLHEGICLSWYLSKCGWDTT